MKQWVIPAVVLLAIGGIGLGVGWSINEWQGDEETAAVTGSPTPAGPTQAELDAQRCAAALEAAGNVQPSGGGTGIFDREQGTSIDIPEEIKDAIDRYCH